LRYSCGHVSTKKNVRGIKDAATSTPPQLRSSRYIRYRDNIGYPRYGERYDIGDNQYSSNNLSYCPINRFLESVPTLMAVWIAQSACGCSCMRNSWQSRPRHVHQCVPHNQPTPCMRCSIRSTQSAAGSAGATVWIATSFRPRPCVFVHTLACRCS
jgi:hypothetical protein